MTLRPTQTALSFLLALLLNVAWAGGGDLVLCLGTDGHTHVKLAGNRDCAEAEGAEHDSLQERLQTPCDDLPIGDTIPSLPKKWSGRIPAVAAPPLLCPSGSWVTSGPSFPQGSTERAPFGQLLIVRTVVLRL